MQTLLCRSGARWQGEPSHLSHLPVDQPFSFCAVQVTFRASLVLRTNPVLLSSIGRLVI